MDTASLNYFLSKFPNRIVANSDASKPPRIVTCVCRLAFAHLAKPQERVSQETKEKFNEWCATLIIPPTADVSVLQGVAAKVAEQKFGANWRQMELRNPLRPQAKNAGKYDGFSNEGFFMDTTSRYPVQVVGNKRGADGQFPVLDLNAPGAVYSGMWVIATLEPYSYSNKQKGVKFGLRALQKIADDEEFKGASAAEAFEDVDYSGVARGSANAGVSAPMNSFDAWG